jgi:hypothetical protein
MVPLIGALRRFERGEEGPSISGQVAISAVDCHVAATDTGQKSG